MIFQDAISSLNPRRRVREVVAEPLVVRWQEEHRRSPLILAWERYVPVMLRMWRHRIVRRLAVPIVVTFFVGLIVWVIATALGDNTASGVRDGGVAATVGNVLMIAALIVAAPLAADVPRHRRGSGWCSRCSCRIAGIPRSIRLRRERPAFMTETEVRVRAVLEDVGIDADAAMDRRPHEFSGGQAQRISIARALILDPKVIICDEPVSALDVSVQAQVLNLMEDLKLKYGISLIFIAHDLAVVKSIADRVMVMYLGKVCEVSSPDDLFARPLHPYTKVLMTSIPVTDPSVDPRQAITISGELPSPVDPPSGCRFRTRCPRATDRCAAEEPVLRELRPGSFAACHHPMDDEDAERLSATASSAAASR